GGVRLERLDRPVAVAGGGPRPREVADELPALAESLDQALEHGGDLCVQTRLAVELDQPLAVGEGVLPASLLDRELEAPLPHERILLVELPQPRERRARGLVRSVLELQVDDDLQGLDRRR